MEPEYRTRKSEFCDHKEQTHYSDDIFHESELSTADVDDLALPMEEVLPSWLDETRLACFLVGAFGLLFTIINLDFFYQQISNPFLLNLSLLMGLGGFANFMVFPNVLKYCLVNGLKKVELLRGLRNFMLAFSALLFVFLFFLSRHGLRSFALILIPAPLIFSYFSKKYIDEPVSTEGIRFTVLTIFNQDIRRLAWFSFTLIFIALIFAFVGVLFGFI
ncbi:MAG: hypothetical protein IPL46_12700 [Saprospiraceae bacterium]|nr:hypothetical protein [Saprospiraceae bacterium]